MYLRLARFILGPGKSDVVKGVEDEILLQGHVHQPPERHLDPIIAHRPGSR